MWRSSRLTETRSVPPSPHAHSPPCAGSRTRPSSGPQAAGGRATHISSPERRERAATPPPYRTSKCRSVRARESGGQRSAAGEAEPAPELCARSAAGGYGLISYSRLLLLFDSCLLARGGVQVDGYGGRVPSRRRTSREGPARRREGSRSIPLSRRATQRPRAARLRSPARPPPALSAGQSRASCPCAGAATPCRAEGPQPRRGPGATARGSSQTAPPGWRGPQTRSTSSASRRAQGAAYRRVRPARRRAPPRGRTAALAAKA
mmetsp:Transcript_12655/g.40339  ORF Transcript_12655/g.40339 Transcript_12655/m.40339 type:complete len:263 (-) Transcript_12655:374-1162(-)